MKLIILSPGQSQMRFLDNLLHCSKSGTKLGWLINPEEEIILAVFPEQKIELYQDQDVLPVLENIDLNVTVGDIFSWLTI
jgi:Uma2 family endonuclease